MSYSINRYNGATLTVVEDGTIDNTLDIKLIGKNYAGYGEVQNENFVHLLEHFSSAGPDGPPRPLSGQVWYDSSAKKLKFYDNSKWRTTGGAEISETPPTGLTEGDFWWDMVNEQLNAWNGSQFVLVGPQGVSGSGTTQLKSRSIKATSGTGGGLMPVIQAIVDDSTIYIISKESFVIDDTVPGNSVAGFGIIKAGITLADTNNEDGVTTTSTEVFHGTATNALRLGGYAAADFLSLLNFDFSSASSAVGFNDFGFTVGGISGALSDTLTVNITGGNPIIKSATPLITFQTTSGTVKTPLTLSANNILPGADSVSNIGSSSFKYATIYATSFNGPATQADTLRVSGSTYQSATTSAGNNTIAARDTGGDLTANVFHGVATTARYADLAEKYLADAEYDQGTVVCVGGEKEITASDWGKRAIGVVSTNPAYMMNSELVGGTYIALKGRVPVKVIGTVTKGDRLISSATLGVAVSFESITAADSDEDAAPNLFFQHTFAIALESSDDTGEKLIEAIVL
jgi:hypothetical protein